MQTIEVETLPIIKFAHVYSAKSYTNSFPIRPNAMEISFISQGSLHIEYAGTEYTAKKGDIICLPYHHAKINVHAESFHEHRTVLAEFSWRVMQDRVNGLYLPLHTPAELNTKAAENIIQQFIRNQLLFKDSPTKGATMFLDLLCEIDHCNRKIKRMNVPSEVLYTRRAKEYVHDHLHLPISEKRVADYLSVSPEYLCYVFKKNEGVSLIRYTNMEKLQAIRSLMEKEGLHLYQAASIFGYNDPNYVSRLFKKYYGYCITEHLHTST